MSQTMNERGAARSHTVVDSPVGPLTLVVEDGELVGLYMDAQAHRPAIEPDETTSGSRDVDVLAEARQQLDAYFAGDLNEFDLPLRMVGTDFQRRVWSALQEIPYGETWSYGELARHIGQPTASRAVGLANGRNPIGIVVPCHRVIGSGGKLVGYGGGMERKRFLLDHEQGRRLL